MRIEFKAKKLFERIPVDEHLKMYYEMVMMSFVDQVSERIDTSKLAAIIVPEDFRTEVMTFQKSIGERPSLTKNEYAEAFSKLLYDKSQDTYYVFLESCIAQYIIGDKFVAVFAKGEDTDTFLDRRSVALTMLTHEMAHASIYERIWGNDEVKKESLLRYLSTILFDEYCACRISNSLVTGSANASNQVQICELEELIEHARGRFGNNEININQFADILFQHTELILKYVVSYVGAQHGRGAQDIDYTDGYIAKITPIFARKLNRLFDNLEAGRTLDFGVISDVIQLYFDTMGIKMVENKSGFALGINDRET